MDLSQIAPVSVIVPTFNRRKFLPDALRSIAEGSLRPAEIIVIDDGSTEDIEGLPAIAAYDVRYYRQENQGKSRALNLGMTYVTQDIIWIFDDDDLACPNALRDMYDALSTSPAADFVVSKHVFFEEQNNHFVIDTPKLATPEPHDLFLDVLERCYMFQGAMLVRRRAYQKVGPFDETLIRSQDYEMLIRLSRHCSGKVINSVCLQMRRHSGPRGTLSAPILQENIEAAWLKADKSIFTGLYDDLALDEYLPRGTAAEADVDPRALLVRASIMARKGLFDLALDDLKRLTRTGGAGRSLGSAFVRTRVSRLLDPDSRIVSDISACGAVLRSILAACSSMARLQMKALLLLSAGRRLKWNLTQRRGAGVTMALVRTVLFGDRGRSSRSPSEA